MARLYQAWLTHQIRWCQQASSQPRRPPPAGTLRMLPWRENPIHLPGLPWLQRSLISSSRLQDMCTGRFTKSIPCVYPPAFAALIGKKWVALTYNTPRTLDLPTRKGTAHAAPSVLLTHNASFGSGRPRAATAGSRRASPETMPRPSVVEP